MVFGSDVLRSAENHRTLTAGLGLGSEGKQKPCGYDGCRLRLPWRLYVKDGQWCQVIAGESNRGMLGKVEK
jgi:hypothetical protein